MSESPLVVAVPEVAHLLGVSRAVAYDLVRRGELPSVRLGRRLVVPRHRLLQLVAAGSENRLLPDRPLPR